MESATKGLSHKVIRTAFGITIYRSNIQTLEGLNWPVRMHNTIHSISTHAQCVLTTQWHALTDLIVMSTSKSWLIIANQKKRSVVECMHLVLSSMRSSLHTGALEPEHGQARQKLDYILQQSLPWPDIHSFYHFLQVDIFAHEIQLIPICLRDHWATAVIDFPTKEIVIMIPSSQKPHPA